MEFGLGKIFYILIKGLGGELKRCLFSLGLVEEMGINREVIIRIVRVNIRIIS